jgi:transposase-like protein
VLFRGRHFRDEIVILCVRWYLRCSLSYRDLEDMMTERGLSVDHSTIARSVLRCAPVLNERLRRSRGYFDEVMRKVPRDVDESIFRTWTMLLMVSGLPVISVI